MGTAVADSVTSAGMSTETFALAQVWAQIEAAPRPQPLQFPNLGDLVLQATPAPLPPGTPGKAWYWGAGVLSFLSFIVASIAWPQGWPAMAMLALLVGWLAVKHLKSKAEPQRLARLQQREAMLATYEDAKDRMRRTVGPDAFDALKSALVADKQRLEGLDIEETGELDSQRQQIQARLATGARTLRGCSPPYSPHVENQWAVLREHARRLAQAEANLSLWS